MLNCGRCPRSCAISSLLSNGFLHRTTQTAPLPGLQPIPLRFPLLNQTSSEHRRSVLQPLAASAVASADPSAYDDEQSRTHNARSAAVLSYLESPAQSRVIDDDDDNGEDSAKKEMIEVYPLGRRNPSFPGAIAPPKIDVESLVLGDERELRRAIEVRRGVAAELLKEAMRSSRLSLTYSASLVSRLPGFVDQMLIEAARMKRNPEFSHLNFNARVNIYIDSSGVIPLVKWLKHNSLSYPQIGKTICSCAGDLQRLKFMAGWLKSIHVKGSFLGVVLSRVENLMNRSVEELEEIVEYLEENGVRRDWVGFVIGRCPQLLSLSMDCLEQRVDFYLKMGMSKNDFGTMVYEYPKALGFFTIDEMKEKANYLREFGLNTEELGRLFAHKPQLMGCSIEDKWKPLVKYLYYLGVRRDGMRRILVIKPMVFCADLETTISPKVRFLQDMGVRSEALGGVIVKFPPILTYNLHRKIQPVVVFLMTRAGVSRENIGKVLALEPELIGCSITEKLDVNVKYFLSLGIPPQSLGEMIADFPMLLKYNLDVLRPKYRYLRRVMVRPLQDLIEFPRFFSYSLEGRIIPRHKSLVANQINFKLRYMLPGSDEVFEQRVREAIEKRKRFESLGAGEVSCPMLTQKSTTAD
ncbi:mitochondrial transcription termination factor family protein [Wolffia australiana]